MGELRQALPAQAAKRVRGAAPVDLTSFSGRELQACFEALRPQAPALPEPEPEPGSESEVPASAFAARIN